MSSAQRNAVIRKRGLARALRLTALIVILAAFSSVSSRALPVLQSESLVSGLPPRSSDPTPHFEKVNGRSVLYVDGIPHTVLTVEIPWTELIYGRYLETQSAYDYLYPAARKMHLNALKVPVKWSQVEPREGVYDFSYVDHALKMAREHSLRLVLGWFGHYASGDGNIYRNLTSEVFAPMYIIEDDKRFPRAVDAEGRSHHNAISYEYPAVIQKEVGAFTAFMGHLKEVDSERRTVVMIQVENEIAVFGFDRQNRKMWRDHSPAANTLFREKGFNDDLRYSAWRLSTNWIKPITDAGAAVYRLPFFLNYVGGKLTDWMVGGSPGEDVETFLDNCPNLDFIGVNLYPSGDSSLADFRAKLNEYSVGRNLPAITETNSDRTPVAPRLAFVSVGEYGAPIFAPWALNISYPTSYQPYVLDDGLLANGAPALSECYSALSQALPLISYFAGTPRLKVFSSTLPGTSFQSTVDLEGTKVTVAGQDNGQAIVIRASGEEHFAVGYRTRVSIWDDTRFVWPALKRVLVERVRWADGKWHAEGSPRYVFNQSDRTLSFTLSTPQVVRITIGR
jgi:hypothetical protein